VTLFWVVYPLILLRLCRHLTEIPRLIIDGSIPVLTYIFCDMYQDKYTFLPVALALGIFGSSSKNLNINFLQHSKLSMFTVTTPVD